MKAEERKHLKENEFQTWLSRLWASMMSGSTLNTIIWCAILLGLALLLGWRYFSRVSYENQSAMWYALDNAGSVDALNAIIKENKDNAIARVARFHLARYQMQDALNRLSAPNPKDRVAAADELEAARDAYKELIKQSAKDPAMLEEAMMNVAKAEETLASVPKADSETTMRGSLDEALRLYRELAAKFPKSYLGEQAAARAKTIEDHRTQIEGFYITLSKEHGQPPAAKPLELPPPPAAPPASPPQK